MIKQGILGRRTSRVRDKKNALKRHKEDIRQEILSIVDEKWKDESPSLKARMSQYGNSPPMKGNARVSVVILIKSPDDITRKFIRKILHQSSRIKSKLLIARFILASSCRMSLSSVVFWTKDKLLGKIVEGKEIKVNWEIQPVWDDIVVMGRLFPFTRYCGNDTKALYRTCNEAAEVLSTC
ncbi:hypothetical protein ERO13_D07G084766v2 [Gossypium hirsutum]|uniref:Uncharacterized protein n=2 Tax=Gossypium TaxID=3633 RepID=A0A5D2K662_GOSTO|nr:hypothetical protein ERO13_D07G084766v2 [Gossypium hirsutum]TYG60770.1 hypothetical protein ES288_D07G094200v1 [Gossypium darwinii]TYH62076.1 hypothetical protein ES332_D07G093700v1 [Gossypium tomentosum]